MRDERTSVDWKAVALYYALACTLSWPFIWWRDMHRASWLAWEVPRYFRTTFYMWGPGVAAVITLALFGRRHVRTITFLGRSTALSTAFYFVPLTALVLVHVPGGGGRTVPLLLGIAAVSLFNILGEELGWRGFLQDALRPLPRLQRYTLLGAMWEFWHFTTRIAGGAWPQTALRLTIMYPATILLSAVIGELTDRTRALLAAVTVHFWLDALLEVPRLLDAAPARTASAFAASVLFWALLLYADHRRETFPAAAGPAVA